MSFSQVLDRWGDNVGDVIKSNSKIAFLDEFRIAAISSYNRAPSRCPELVVFNTLVSQDHPGSFQRFRFPSRYSGWYARIYPELYEPLEAVDGDGPLIVD